MTKYLIIKELPSGKELRKIDVSLDEADSIMSFDWSPDEKRVAIAVSKTIPGQGQVWNLYILDIETLQMKQITNFTQPKAFGLRFPKWSPDGSKVLFSYPKHPDTSEVPVSLYTINPDGSDLKELLGEKLLGGGEPSWSSDGKKIVFRSTPKAGDFEQIYVLDLATYDIGMITNYPIPKDNPVFSPDGMKICFVGQPRGLARNWGSQLFVVNVDGTGLAKLTEPVELKSKAYRHYFSSDESPVWRVAAK